MHPRYLRYFVISALVLTSLGTLTYVASAADNPVTIGFYCVAPLFGTTRCGPADQNLHVGRGKRLSIQLESAKNMDDKPRCITFFIIHAVSGEQIGSEVRICSSPSTKAAWTNDRDQLLDVYMTVKSDGPERVRVSGQYIIDGP